jgi:hemolysin III
MAAGGAMRSIEDRTVIEEIINSITHGVGLVLSVIGFGVLLALAIVKGTAWQIAGSTVFGVTLIFLYTASTLYHALRSPRAKGIFKIVDHSAIYLLIAGTYTPFTLVNLRGPWGWTLFGLIWTLAAIGIALKIFHVDKFQILSTIVYVLMGWMGIIAIKPLFATVPVTGLVWLFAGGFFYTSGVVFFASKRIPYNHAIWHVFVMAGSICHYFAVLYAVLGT